MRSNIIVQQIQNGIKNVFMNLKNHFLIAMPSLDDTLFQRSVVFIFEHNKEGAAGIIINKPIENMFIDNIIDYVSMTEPPSQLLIQNYNEKIFNGGPLAHDRGFILHSNQTGFTSSIQISDHLMLTTSQDILRSFGTQKQPKKLLMASGYSAWEPGQLEDEIKHDQWIIVEANEDVLFHTPVEKRWELAAKSIGVDIEHISHSPLRIQ